MRKQAKNSKYLAQSQYSVAIAHNPSAVLPPITCLGMSQGWTVHQTIGLLGHTYPSCPSLWG